MTYDLPFDGQDPWGDTFRAAWDSLVSKVSTQGSQYLANIKDYGAIGDGTNNDTSYIQAAVDDVASSGGGTLFIPPGTFRLTDEINWRNTVSVRGSGQDVSILKVTDGVNKWAINFSEETRGAFFEDFTVDGGIQTTDGGGIKASGAVECRLSRLHFTSCYNWGLEFGPNSDDSFGHNNLAIGCWFDSGPQQVGNGSGSTGYGGGIHTTSNDENWIAFCDFVYLGGTGHDGADYPACIFDQSGLICVYACNFVSGDHYVAGVYSKDMTAARVIGCNFDGVHGSNVVVNGFGHIIQNNYFSSPGLTNSGVDEDHQVNGIELGYGSNHCSVIGNTLIAAPHDGSGDGANIGYTWSLIKETGDGDAGSNVIMGNTICDFDRGSGNSPRGGSTAGPSYDLSGKGSVVLGNIGLPDKGAKVPTVVYYGPDENDVSPGRSYTNDTKPTADDYTVSPYFGNGSTIMANFTFTKANDSTSMEVSLEMSGYASATVTTDQFGVVAGLRITNAVSLAGTNYDVATQPFVGDSQYRFFSGRKMINGLPAGSYKGAVYIVLGDNYTPGNGYAFQTGSDGVMYLRIEEVQM